MKSLRAIMRTPTALVIIIAAILTLIGVIIKSVSDTNIAKLPIHATETAEAKLTALALVPTLTSSSIPASTPTLTTIPISTSVSTPTETLAPTEVSQSLFEEEFIDNRNGWLIQNEQDIKSSILGGKYKHTIDCPSTYSSFYCGYYFKVPNLQVKNFRFAIDTMIERISLGSEVMVAFQFRDVDNNYYIVFFKSTGKYSMSVTYQGTLSELSEYKPISNLSGIGSVNRLGIHAQDTRFIPSVNGIDLEPSDDGNINQEGSFYLVIYVSRGGSTAIEFDNLIVSESP